MSKAKVKRKRTKPQSAITVTQGADKQTIMEVQIAISNIIRGSDDPTVLVKALDVLDHSTTTKPLSISNCHFQMGA